MRDADRTREKSCPKVYVTPELTVYGDVQAVTKEIVGGAGDGQMGASLPPA